VAVAHAITNHVDDVLWALGFGGGGWGNCASGSYGRGYGSGANAERSAHELSFVEVRDEEMVALQTREK